MTKNKEEITEAEKQQKIQSLRDMVNSAEKTIQGAKAMLLQLEGKKKTGRRRKVESEEDGQIVEGVFDGQIMIGNDGKQYPVPANYASKSKLVEGDILKLTITPDGFFIYKQIGPADRKNAIGIISQDEVGNYYVITDGKPYKILLASITYFKADPGDEVAIVAPREEGATWASIENVLQKGKEAAAAAVKKSEVDKELDSIKKLQKDEASSTNDPASVVDEWTSDIEEIKKEIKESDIP